MCSSPRWAGEGVPSFYPMLLSRLALQTVDTYFSDLKIFSLLEGDAVLKGNSQYLETLRYMSPPQPWDSPRAVDSMQSPP